MSRFVKRELCAFCAFLWLLNLNFSVSSVFSVANFSSLLSSLSSVHFFYLFLICEILRNLRIIFSSVFSYPRSPWLNYFLLRLDRPKAFVLNRGYINVNIEDSQAGTPRLNNGGRLSGNVRK